MKQKKQKGYWLSKLKNSPINYFSDLFIVSMVVMWIVDNVYESVIATIVTMSSIALSHETGIACYDTTMWSSIGANVAIPLSCGGAIWMVKNSIQHAISNYKGKQASPDFPAVEPELEHETIETEQPMDMSSQTEEIQQLDVVKNNRRNRRGYN